jgi:hypothetical protein
VDVTFEQKDALMAHSLRLQYSNKKMHFIVLQKRFPYAPKRTGNEEKNDILMSWIFLRANWCRVEKWWWYSTVLARWQKLLLKTATVMLLAFLVSRGILYCSFQIRKPYMYFRDVGSKER